LVGASGDEKSGEQDSVASHGGREKDSTKVSCVEKRDQVRAFALFAPGVRDWTHCQDAPSFAALQSRSLSPE
jgi:hypothetical protein